MLKENLKYIINFSFVKNLRKIKDFIFSEPLTYLSYVKFRKKLRPKHMAML